MSANRRTGPAFRPGLFVGLSRCSLLYPRALPSRSIVGPDAVLVAGSGLIIRLRKDIVGSNPTRPTNPFYIADPESSDLLFPVIRHQALSA
ncbi:hypothetical protein PSAB6_10327 [Paraburkholderia sabiae]|nr:hypothetical protein PSAB6_10327 [Paraburkholderia sabiae]